MSAERWGVRFYDEIEGRDRRWRADGKPWAGSLASAVGIVRSHHTEPQIRPVRLIPKKKPERRVFEGKVRRMPVEEVGFCFYCVGHTTDDDWLGGPVGGLDGKRVRLTVEVLPDAKEKP